MMCRLACIALLLSLCGCAGHTATRTDDGTVLLSLRRPDASRVRVATSADHFQPHDAVRGSLGAWEVALPLPPGASYFYLVDGAVLVPDCRYRETDDFGAENCVYLP